ASFSSRGPSTYDFPNVLKPNVSAPGVNVRSSYGSNDTAYQNLSGTSIAGPHAPAVAALLWSAHRQFARDIASTKSIFENTANPNAAPRRDPHASPDPDRDTHANADPNRNTDADTDRDADTDTDADRNTDAYSNANRDTDGDANANSDPH